jgi:hypothetical protein
LMAAFTVAAALVVVAVFGPTNLSRRPRQTQPSTPAERPADAVAVGQDNPVDA